VIRFERRRGRLTIGRLRLQWHIRGLADRYVGFYWLDEDQR